MIPQIQRVDFREYDPERFRSVVEGADLEHTFLAPGLCTATVYRVQTPRLAMDSGLYRFPVGTRGAFAPGRISIGFTWGNSSESWVNGIETNRSRLVIFSEGSDLMYRAQAETGWTVIGVSRRELQEQAVKSLGRELLLPEVGTMGLNVPAELLDRLVKGVLSSGDHLRERPGDAGIVDQQIVQLCVELIGAGASEQGGQVERRAWDRFQTIRRADQAMRHLIGSGYSSDRLCRSIGVTERTLQLVFKESFGVNPKAWFQRIALNRAHVALLTRPFHKGLVTEVALDFGFEHFGRFSQAYRELFGRSPSETLRARGGGGLSSV